MPVGRKVKCPKCGGTGFYSGRYGQTACDLGDGCRGTGYIYIRPEKCLAANGRTIARREAGHVVEPPECNCGMTRHMRDPMSDEHDSRCPLYEGELETEFDEPVVSQPSNAAEPWRVERAHQQDSSAVVSQAPGREPDYAVAFQSAMKGKMFASELGAAWLVDDVLKAIQSLPVRSDLSAITIEDALAELREMFPGRICTIACDGFEPSGKYGKSVYVRISIRPELHCAGATLDEAMQKVREFAALKEGK